MKNVGEIYLRGKRGSKNLVLVNFAPFYFIERKSSENIL